MPTVNQLIRKPRKRQRRKRDRVLAGRPFRQGIVIRVRVVDPKKPNAANRFVARVRFPDGTEVTAYDPGEGHYITEHSRVLVKGGSMPDLPGVHHKLVRGKLDNPAVKHSNDKAKTPRRQSRSKYGVKK